MVRLIGFCFDSHWLKNWRESFKPITKRSNRNHVITFDTHLKTALCSFISCCAWFFRRLISSVRGVQLEGGKNKVGVSEVEVLFLLDFGQNVIIILCSKATYSDQFL